MTEFEHYSVLLDESIEGLAIKPDGIYVDCTLGGAGHSRKILEKLNENGHLYAFDQDRIAIENAERELAPYIEKGQVTLIKENFRYLKEELETRGVEKVDGILYDLGVSSPQLDQAERGFSYRFDAPLDMRMNQDQELTAMTIVNSWTSGRKPQINRQSLVVIITSNWILIKNTKDGTIGNRLLNDQSTYLKLIGNNSGSCLI